MFTGLIETTGVILSIEHSTKQTDGNSSSSEDCNTYARVRIGSPNIVHSSTAIGDSLSVNGVCLTVVQKSPHLPRIASILTHVFTQKPQNAWLEVEILRITLEKTSMHALKIHDTVNLERAMRASERIGGHFVTGHIACVGIIEALHEDDENCFLTVKIPKQYMKYMIPEGSITLDGISLTIATINHNSITCNIIPHTRAVTNLRDSVEGDKINIEPDIIARYVENMMYNFANKTETEIDNNSQMTCHVI